VLRRPSIIPRLLRAFSKPDETGSEEGCGTLMSIAVSPQTQSRGVGQMLVWAFIREAARRNLRSINLTTDQDNNERANLFYQKLGFTCSRSFVTPEGRRMNEYSITLNQTQGIINEQQYDPNVHIY
jgi:ribosomal protein S18 acetylase RimI-like enzyme